MKEEEEKIKETILEKVKELISYGYEDSVISARMQISETIIIRIRKVLGDSIDK